MNTEVLQDQALNTTGGRLRQARENMGLSQQTVAERLCLTVSTVQDIENDHINPNIASTFLRGYIRSYARLVHISEKELALMMAKQAPIKASQVAPIQNFSLGKTSRKKRDTWLVIFAWLILFMSIGLTGVWWWQNHQIQNQNIASITSSSSNVYRKNADNSVLTTVSAMSDQAISQDKITSNTITKTKTGSDDIDNNTLIMNFIDDCWLEVFDSRGKKLFSGMQHNGAKLNLIGQAPYRLKIGAPAAVHIQYQGKQVDLSKFIQLNQVARLTVEAK